MASEVITRDMYGGTVHLVHDPLARGRAPRYTVTTKDGLTKPKGVTSILGQTLAKDFIGWAIESAVAYLRIKLPVITEEDLVLAGKEHIRLRDEGAGFGTEAHKMVENFLKGQPVTLGSQEANNAFGAFVKWFEDVKPVVIGVEEVVYSKELEYAGTYDCMLEIDGKVVLGDYKTTNSSRKAPDGVYAEHFLQLGAYALAHEERRKVDTDLPKIDDLAVLSGKKTGKFDVVFASDLGLSVAQCGELFRYVLMIHRFMVDNTKKLGGR